jgi:hypothetical protein
MTKQKKRLHMRTRFWESKSKMDEKKALPPVPPSVPTDLKQIIIQYSPKTGQLYVTSVIRNEEEKAEVIKAIASAIPAVVNLRPSPLIMPTTPPPNGNNH